jgi:hypothetical protein
MGKCTQVKRTEQVLEACNAYFGDTHCRIVKFADDTAGDQSDSWIDLNAIVIENNDYEESQFELVLDNGSGTHVVASGKTAILVVYTDDDDAETIAGLAKTAIEAVIGSPFVVTQEGAELHIQNKFIGPVADESAAGAGDLEVELGREGFGGSLGAFAEGGATLSVEREVLDVTSDQTGALILDSIIRGTNLSLSATLAEMTEKRWEDLIGRVAGDILEVNGVKLIGWGESKLNQSLIALAGKIVLHPIRLPLTDRSRDIMFWKTAPNMNTINFSGSEVQGAEFEFGSYLDANVAKEVNLGVKGDWTLAI